MPLLNVCIYQDLILNSIPAAHTAFLWKPCHLRLPKYVLPNHGKVLNKQATSCSREIFEKLDKRNRETYKVRNSSFLPHIIRDDKIMSIRWIESVARM
jgi:hypothetical protein